MATLGRDKAIQQPSRDFRVLEKDQSLNRKPRLCTSKQWEAWCGPTNQWLIIIWVLASSCKVIWQAVKSLSEWETSSLPFFLWAQNYLENFYFWGLEGGPLFQQSDRLRDTSISPEHLISLRPVPQLSMALCLSAHMYQCPQRPERGVSSPGAGAAGSCESPSVGARKQALLFYKNSKCS